MAAEDDEVEEMLAKKKQPPKRKEVRAGGVMKAVVREGGGGKTPQTDDQVIFHCTTRTSEGVTVDSTRSEHGGKGFPHRMVLGKSKMLVCWEEAFPSMHKGEVAMLKVMPELHYGDPDCPIQVSENHPKTELLFFEIELLDFMPVKAVTEDGGVTKQVLVDGKSWETPRTPYEVKISVVGRVSGGPTFLNRTSEDPLVFAFGKAEVPAGLEQGIGTMVKEEKAVIYMSKSYLHPVSAIPNLPVDAQEVEFEVQLIQIIQVRDMLGDGGVVKRRVRDGRGDFPVDCPLEDSLLRIHYKGRLPNEGGRVFYDTRVDDGGQPLEFSSGEGLVPEGLEVSCRLMLPGELALISCQPQYAYDKFPRPDSVPEGAHVQWEVELLGFDKAKDWTGLNFKEIMAEADKIKGTGNRLFKEGKYELAKAKYDKVLKDFNHVNPQDDAEGKELFEMKNAIQLNVAACLHNLREYVKCIELCNKVVEESPHLAKAYYRRGLAYTATGDFEDANADFNRMMLLDESTESAGKVALAKVKKREQESEIKARKQFKGLFDKKPGELSEEPGNTSLEGQESKGEVQEKAADTKRAVADEENIQSSRLSSIFSAAKAVWKKSSLSRCSIL